MAGSVAPEGKHEEDDSEPATRAVTPTPTVASDDAPLPPGALLGRYIVLRPLGAGGLGEVHVAYDPQLDRRVAVKVLKAKAQRMQGARELQARLVREAQAMAKLAHPNVVSVYDVGIDGDKVFVAMELVEGVTLREWLRAETRTWKHIRDVMLQAGEGVRAAHRAGLLHRDLKPSNVIVGNDGRVRVLDFGLARAVTPRDSGDTLPVSGDAWSSKIMADPVTDARSLMGTPGYMAPEQYAHGVLDVRTDEFAFCVTMWESLYGRRPFRGKTLGEVRSATMAGKLPEPGDAPPPRSAPATSTSGSKAPLPAVAAPTWLREVLARGLRPDPDDRYPSFDDLLAALVRDRAARRRYVMLGIAAMLVVVLGSVGLWFARPEPTADSRIEALANAARAAAAKIYFVYPPPDDPDAPTAYRIVQELEAIEGELHDEAQASAAALRDEFAATLTRLGDRYWDEEGGRPFAIDYYVAALVFEPGNARARERAAVTTGELITLREKADTAAFTPAELQAAQTLVALAEPEEPQRVAKVAKILRDHQHRGATTTANLERLIEPAAEVIAAKSTKTPATTVAPADPVPPASDPAIAPEPASAGEPGAVSGRGKKGKTEPVETTTSANVPADPAQARESVQKAQAALKSGNIKDAESWFHRALESDRKQPDALVGLAELYFEQGAYQKALGFAKRGVGAAPKSARHQLIYGDVCFKVLRYADARAAYEAAKALGQPNAQARLDRLDRTLGSE